MRTFCHAYLTWYRLSVDAMGWTRFQAWLNTPPPDAKPDPKVLEAEGQAFLEFMGAAGSVPDGAEGGDAA